MPAHGPRLTMRDLTERYLNRRRAQVARSTLDSARTTLGRFAAWWDGPTGGKRKVPGSLTENDLEAYLWSPHECDRKVGCKGTRIHKGGGLRDTATTDEGFNGELARLRGFLSWAARNGHIRPETVQAAARDAQARGRKRRRLRLSESQLGAVLENASDPWERAVIALCMFTAGRTSELQSLRIGDVDLDAHEITWTRHKTGDDSDYLPITSDLAAEIERWFAAYTDRCGPLRDDWYLIPRRTIVGRSTDPAVRVRLDPDRPRAHGLHEVVKRHMAAVLGTDEDQLQQEGVHTLRRSMARVLYERLRDGGQPDPIAVVQALLGHASRTMTERYIGVESGREARDKLLKGNSIFGR